MIFGLKMGSLNMNPRSAPLPFFIFYFNFFYCVIVAHKNSHYMECERLMIFKWNWKIAASLLFVASFECVSNHSLLWNPMLEEA